MSVSLTQAGMEMEMKMKMRMGMDVEGNWKAKCA